MTVYILRILIRVIKSVFHQVAKFKTTLNVNIPTKCDNTRCKQNSRILKLSETLNGIDNICRLELGLYMTRTISAGTVAVV